MAKWNGLPTLILGLLLSGQALALDLDGFERRHAVIARDAGCSPEPQGEVVRYGCPSAFTLWYVTRTGHPAYPAIIERKMVRTAGGIQADANGMSFAGPEGRPAFNAWLAEIRALDH